LGKGLRKKSQSDFLNKLTSDCITFRLKEKEALEYIEKEFGESISKRSYWHRRRRILNDNSQTSWMDWFTSVGFVQSHRRQTDDIEKINNDSMHRLYQLTHQNILGKIERGDESLILKLKDDIRQNVRMLAELGDGTPVISAIKKRIEDARTLQKTSETNKSQL
jgi:hypothetical protein